MVGLLSTTSSLERQPVDSQIEERPETYYLFNTDNISKMTMEGFLDSRLGYKLNILSDRSGEFILVVDETLNNLESQANVVPASPKIDLDVYEEAQSFNQVSGITPVTWTFNVKDIVWAEGYGSGFKGAYCRIWICKGGHSTIPYIVDHSLLDIIWLIYYGDQF